jgi:hypothetical protein
MRNTTDSFDWITYSVEKGTLNPKREREKSPSIIQAECSNKILQTINISFSQIDMCQKEKESEEHLMLREVIPLYIKASASFTLYLFFIFQFEGNYNSIELKNLCGERRIANFDRI